MTQYKHAPRGPLKTKPQDPLRDDNPLRGPNWRGCVAKSKRSGKPCNGQAISGGTVCRMHGGAAPQVKNAADKRLRELEFPAIERIARLIQQDDFPSVAYQASKDVLDRIRGRATEHIDAKVTNLTNLSDEELREKALILVRGGDDE